MAKYEGTVNGRHLQSLYPNVYRVSFRAVIAGRDRGIEQTIAATSEAHARERAQREHRDIRGTISVEQIGTLEKVD
jgi:hypothetical protein